MDIRTELEKKIRCEKENIAGLRIQIARSEAFVEGLQEAQKLLPEDQGGAPRARARGLRLGGDVQKAQRALLECGQPLHVSDILPRIDKEDTKQNRASLSSSLARWARRGMIFRRDGPNAFALIEPKQPLHALAHDDVELPQHFGENSV